MVEFVFWFFFQNFSEFSDLSAKSDVKNPLLLTYSRKSIFEGFGAQNRKKRIPPREKSDFLPHNDLFQNVFRPSPTPQKSIFWKKNFEKFSKIFEIFFFKKMDFLGVLVGLETFWNRSFCGKFSDFSRGGIRFFRFWAPNPSKIDFFEYVKNSWFFLGVYVKIVKKIEYPPGKSIVGPIFLWSTNVFTLFFLVVFIYPTGKSKIAIRTLCEGVIRRGLCYNHKGYN